MNAKRFGLTLLLVAGVVLSGCGGSTTSSTTPSAPPPVPSKEELENNLANRPLFWTESQVVYAIQMYCAYTQECDTKHIWLGETWGYDFPSYETTVYGETITIDVILLVHIIQDGRCPDGQEAMRTFRYVTFQGVFDSEGEPIHYFCIEWLTPQ